MKNGGLFLLLALLIVVAPAVTAQDAVSGRPPFAEWLAALRVEAIASGISEATVEAALATVREPNPVVVARDRRQPERVQTLDQYVAQWLTTRTTATARRKRTEHRDLLGRVEATYGVPASIVVSIWGLESNFGRFTGTYPTVPALATLAYDPRRSTLFRRELFDALRIVDQGHVTLANLKGSWAGAMGQPQFMPSSYLRHAEDFDGDGKADIWSNTADVFASIGNYLKAAGWTSGTRWGREVSAGREALDRIEREVPMRSTGCAALRELTEPRPLSTWTALGVRLAGGSALPDVDLAASLVRGEKRQFLVYANYLAVLDYNCSNAYAIAVGLLADKI